MSDIPSCPRCGSTYAYADPSGLFVCPECAHEWSPGAEAEPAAQVDAQVDEGLVVRDAFGNVLQDGDSVTMIKDLKVKGSGSGLKAGTKIKNIRLTHGDHNLDCRVEGVGQIALKSEFVRKA